MALDAPARDAPTRHLAAYVGDLEAARLVGHLEVDVTDFTVRFDAIDRRFEEVDRRFEEVDRRFDQVDQRFDRQEERFDATLDLLEARLTAAFRGEINHAITAQTRPLLITMFSTAVVFAGTVLAVVVQLG